MIRNVIIYNCKMKLYILNAFPRPRMSTKYKRRFSRACLLNSKYTIINIWASARASGQNLRRNRSRALCKKYLITIIVIKSLSAVVQTRNNISERRACSEHVITTTDGDKKKNRTLIILRCKFMLQIYIHMYTCVTT